MEHESSRIQSLGMPEAEFCLVWANMKPRGRLLRLTLVSGSMQLDA